MKITGTQKIRGSLEINSLKIRLSKGQSVFIDNANLYNPDVQIALKSGYVTKSSEENEEDTNIAVKETNKNVKCINSYKRPISIKGFPNIIPVNGEFTLTENQLKDPDIKRARTKGMIKVVQIIDGKTITEGSLNLKDITNPNEEKVLDIQASTPSRRIVPDTNEEVKTLNVIEGKNVINTFTPKPINPEDIGDPRGSSVVWNPAGSSPINEMKGDVITLNENGQIKNTNTVNPSDKEDAKQFTVVSAGKKNQDDVVFVDQQQEQERIMSHPVLKNKIVQDNNGEIEFVG